MFQAQQEIMTQRLKDKQFLTSRNSESNTGNFNDKYYDTRIYRKLFKLSGIGFDPAWRKVIKESFLEEMARDYIFEIWVEGSQVKK